ncbi:MAG: RHS repeat-associated core domain-containing protein [Candidatus Thiodiazotropha sp.]
MSVSVTRTPLSFALLAAFSLTAGLAQADRTVSYTYTDLGQVATLDGPRLDVSDVTTYDYDTQGNRISVTNALTQTTQIPDHDPSGRPLTAIDPNGLTTHLSYDPRGRLTEQRQTDGLTTRTTTYTYDPVGNLTRVTQDDGSYLSYTYDAAHRLTGLEDHLGNRIIYTLDLMGHTTREEVQDPQGNLTRLKKQVYDVLGQVRQQQDSQDRATEYDYDPNGNLTHTRDANQHPTTQVYDPLDRLTESTDALQGVTDYEYDAQGNLVQVTDPTGLTTTYDYDGLGNLLSQSSPDTGTTTYSYDEAGNRLSQTDARGVTVHYTYDALNRLTAIAYPDGSRNISYSYDQGAYGIGRLTRMQDAEGATDYAYNAYGDLITHTRTSLDGGVTQYTYSYDTQGYLASLGYPSGHRVHYSYNQGQLTGLSLETPEGATQPLVSQIQRLPFGPIRALDFGNGLSLSRTYDQDYRLIAQSLPGVLEDSYGHDPVGNIIDWQDLLQTARDQQFGYDELDRLISASGAYGDLGYAYDPIGNRLSLSEGTDTETYDYVPDTHRLHEILGASVDTRQYDANGNTLESAQGSYTYDDTNRMVSFTQGSTAATYAYNGKGERIRKDVNGAITRFRYAPSGALLGEYDATGQAIREYVYLEGQPIAQIAPQTGAAQLLQSVSSNHQSQTVDLGQHPATPVVIASPLTYNGGQGAVVALDNLQSTQVSVRVKEWDYLDVAHAWEDISLLALPPGRYPQADGSVWEIGRFELSGTRQWQSINFSSAFEATPYLFLTQQTQNDSHTTTVRARSVSVSGFQAQLQEQESLNDGHGAETIGYLAIHSPSGSGQASFYGATLDYQLSTAQLNNTWATVGDQQMQVQEEQSSDTETGHATETIAVLNINGHTFAQDVTTSGTDTSVLRRRGASSEVAISGTPGGGLAYLHTDHLGTVVKATDQAQNVVWDAVRRPFGERAVEVAQVEVLLGFAGQYFDQESGNFYNYFRDYDPTTGRYLQSDPIGLGGGINTYAYVGGNPIGYADPFGLRGPGVVVAPVIITNPAAPGGVGAGDPRGGFSCSGSWYGGQCYASMGDTYNAVDQSNAASDSSYDDDDQCKKCPKCKPPVGTRCYGPKDSGHQHKGADPHWHIYEMEQIPTDCKCQWKKKRSTRDTFPYAREFLQPCTSYPSWP